MLSRHWCHILKGCRSQCHQVNKTILIRQGQQQAPLYLSHTFVHWTKLLEMQLKSSPLDLQERKNKIGKPIHVSKLKNDSIKYNGISILNMLKMEIRKMMEKNSMSILYTQFNSMPQIWRHGDKWWRYLLFPFTLFYANWFCSCHIYCAT